MPASNHKDWRAFHESLEHADCRPVAHWLSSDRPIQTGSTETSCAGELSYRPAACHHGSAQRTSIKSSRGRIPERHRRLSRRHVLSMPGFCSQTAYIFAVPMLPDPHAIGSAWCVNHGATRPCCRRVCALSRVARVASLASFAGFTLAADIANQTHRTRAAGHAAHAQSAFDADQVDCARVAVIAKDSRSAKFASSANPATGKPLRRPMACGVGGFGSASGFLDIISQSSTNRPSPLHLRQTHLHHTSCHRLHDLAHRHRRP